MISALGTAFKYQLFILEVVYLEVENYYLGDKADLLYSAVGTEAPPFPLVLSLPAVSFS